MSRKNNKRVPFTFPEGFDANVGTKNVFWFYMKSEPRPNILNGPFISKLKELSEKSENPEYQKALAEATALYIRENSRIRYTVCGILNPTNNTISIGVCRCSKKDQFIKNRGRLTSLYRALKGTISTKIPAGSNPGKEFRELARTYCDPRFVEITKSGRVRNDALSV